MLRHRRAEDESVRLSTTRPSGWEYVYMLDGRVFTFCPRTGWVFATFGTTPESHKEHVRSLGREFDTATEVNAYAAAHHWPNWKPLAE